MENKNKLKTPEILKDAFWKLYAEKDISKIRIAEITDLAGYNRGVFYSYYKNIYEMFDAIVEINKQRNTPIIIVEQNAFMAMSISNRTYVLENGKVAHSGLSKELLESPEIKKAYLGG